MTRSFSLLFTVALTAVSHAAWAETLPSPVAAKELTNKVMARVASGDLEGGIRLLKPYATVPEAEIESAIGQAKLQLPAMSQRFGKSIGRELLREDRAGDSLVRLIYLHKFERHAMRWTFIFYRGSTGWVLNTFYFDDNVRALFPN